MKIFSLIVITAMVLVVVACDNPYSVDTPRVISPDSPGGTTKPQPVEATMSMQGRWMVRDSTLDIFPTWQMDPSNVRVKVDTTTDSLAFWIHGTYAKSSLRDTVFAIRPQELYFKLDSITFSKDSTYFPGKSEFTELNWIRYTTRLWWPSDNVGEFEYYELFSNGASTTRWLEIFWTRMELAAFDREAQEALILLDTSVRWRRDPYPDVLYFYQDSIRIAYE